MASNHIRRTTWFALVALLVLPGCEHQEPWTLLSDVETVPLGTVSPEFSLALFDATKPGYQGEPVFFHRDVLAEGHPVVVNFWATWCGPCVVELPYFVELASRRPGLKVLTVAVADTSAYLPRFIDGSKLSLPVLVDPSGDISGRLESGSLPTTLLFGEGGTLLLRFVGSFYSADHIEKNVDLVLGQRTGRPE